MAIEALNRVEELEKLFAEMLEQAKLESKDDDWIPVSERLPSESDYYLATVKNSFETEVAIIWFAHIDDYGSKSEWREITDDDTVVAWRPLPKPYEESDKE